MSEQFMQSIARENTERRVSYWGSKLRKVANEGHPPQSVARVAPNGEHHTSGGKACRYPLDLPYPKDRTPKVRT